MTFLVQAQGNSDNADFTKNILGGVCLGDRLKSVKKRLRRHRKAIHIYARTAEAMRELFGCSLSTGTLSAAVRQCAAGLVETELQIKQGLRRSPVLHADETGLRVAGRLHYIHVASTSRLTHYDADARRGKAAIDGIGILPQYRGTYVHTGTRCAARTC